MAVSAIRIDNRDNVATLLSDGQAGDIVHVDGVVLGSALAVGSVSGGVTWTSPPSGYVYQVLPLRDWNGDGYGDAALQNSDYTSSYVDPLTGPHTFTYAGRVQIHRGGIGASSGSLSSLTGTITSHYLGSDMVSAGDLDSDGRSDVWLNTHRSYCGAIDICAVLAYGGTIGNIDASRSAISAWLPYRATSGVGRLSGFSAGDTNGDGNDEVLLYSNFYAGNMHSFLFPGQPR